MFGKIPFDLPLQFLPGLATGDIVRYGAILKDAGTGRILGHLQESGIAQSLLSQALSSATSPLSLASSVVNTGSSIYTAIQVRQLKAMMETLQALQVATLGVSLVGVGVSVAGFLYMRKRFNSLDGRISCRPSSLSTCWRASPSSPLHFGSPPATGR
jgi:H+/gluconate symporter-like permease